MTAHENGTALLTEDRAAMTKSPAETTESSASYSGAARARLDHENPKPLPAKARLYGDEEVTLHWQVANPYTEQAIMPPFVRDDLDYVPFLEQPDRDVPRRIAVAAHLAGQHDERHTFWHHPFCYVCTGDELLTHRRLIRWMVLNPAKAIPEGDTALPVLPTAADPSSEFLSPAQVHELGKATTPWLIDQILPAGKHGIIRGRDASFKSFFGLDLCLHLAVGQDWQGRTTSQGRVLYLAGEGVTSFGDRFDAWEETHGALDEDEQEEIRVRNGTVDLHGGGPAFDRLLTFAREWKPRILVADTLQRSAGGADQNNASDMAVLRERMFQLQQAAGGDCTTIFVAHTTKGNGDTRGSSSIEDDADFVLSCTRSEMKLTVGVEKQKDAADGYTIDLAARVVGKSLAIVEPKDAPGIVWTSNSAEAKVIGALRLLDSLGGQSQAAIIRHVDSLAQSTVSEALAKLVKEGAVLKIGPGGRGTTYRLAEPSTDGASDGVTDGGAAIHR